MDSRISVQNTFGVHMRLTKIERLNNLLKMLTGT
jgi:hypothetical protein